MNDGILIEREELNVYVENVDTNPYEVRAKEQRKT